MSEIKELWDLSWSDGFMLTFILMALYTYKVWVDNTLINKLLVNELENELTENHSLNTYVILNFPSKINHAPTLTLDLEPFMNLKTSSNRRIVNPVFIAHNNGIKPTAIHHSKEGIILNACEESSYFVLGKKSFSPGEVLDIKNGKRLYPAVEKTMTDYFEREMNIHIKIEMLNRRIRIVGLFNLFSR